VTTTAGDLNVKDDYVPELLVRRQSFYAVDDDDIDWTTSRFRLQTQLLLKRSKDRWTIWVEVQRWSIRWKLRHCVRRPVVFHDWIHGEAHDCHGNSRVQRAFGANRRCPFLALWAQQRGTNGGNGRHKAKVANRRVLRVTVRDPAVSSTPRQRAANVALFAC